MLQLAAGRVQSGGLIEINRDREAAPDLGAGLVRGVDAIVKRRAGERHEGQDVGRADARMDAGMLAEIDERGGFTDASHGGFEDDGGLAGEGNDAAVVVGIGIKSENGYAVHMTGDARDGHDYVGVAALREIRHAFDHLNTIIGNAPARRQSETNARPDSFKSRGGIADRGAELDRDGSRHGQRQEDPVAGLVGGPRRGPGDARRAAHHGQREAVFTALQTQRLSHHL